MARRRITAVFIALFMLHLTLAGADVACARHGRDASTAMAAGVSAPMHHSGASADAGANGATNAPSERCEIPATTQCCSALASCSVAFSATTRSSRVLPRAREALLIADQLLPNPLAFAPDPPPPKL